MTEHYICTGGCRGVSGKPGTCQAKTCSKHGQPLEYCDCIDGGHGGEFEEDKNPDDSEESERKE